MEVPLVIVLHALLFSYVSTPGVVENIANSLLTNCTGIKSLQGVTYEQLIFSKYKPRKNDINFIYFINKSTKIFSVGGHTQSVSQYINPDLPTEIIIHGYIQSPNNPHVNKVIDALLERGGTNVLLVDASKLLFYPYMYSSTALKFIGEYLGMDLAKYPNVFIRKNIHLIGYSFGAHIAGFAAKTYRQQTGYTLPWITGLDPAGPCYFESVASDRLSKTDADFVDVIHTDMGAWGTTKEIGHIDFYPNGGNFQPGCSLRLCSHERSLYLYAESILHPGNLIAVMCDSWQKFKTGFCLLNRKVIMGYEIPKDVSGSFYLTTKSFIQFDLKSRFTL